MSNSSENNTSDAVVPFAIDISDHEIDDLRQRLAATRLPDPLTGDDWSTGIPVAYLRTLIDAWQKFDWRATEARLNDLPHVTTVIDGQTIHAIHVVSPVDGALPLLLTHGWPGSFLEFVGLIAPLTDPAAHGGDAADAFSVVIPSLPGFGFSSPLVDADWGTGHVAGAWLELMTRLGYEKFAVQGGDVGAGVAPEVARLAPDRIVGVHVNGALGGWVDDSDPGAIAGLTELEQDRMRRVGEFMQREYGYIAIQSTRPGLIGELLTDSPVAQLAWIIDKLRAWTYPADAAPEDVLGLEFVLANASLYWFTRTAGSAALVGYAQDGGWGALPENSGVPTAAIQFAHDVGIRRAAEVSNTIVRWTDVDDRGGHFAALEEPDILVDDIRGFLRPLR